MQYIWYTNIVSASNEYGNIEHYKLGTFKLHNLPDLIRIDRLYSVNKLN